MTEISEAAKEAAEKCLCEECPLEERRSCEHRSGDGECSWLIENSYCAFQAHAIQHAIDTVTAEQETARLIQENQTLRDRVTGLEERLKLAAEQNYCTSCGKTLDGYRRDETISKLQKRNEKLEQLLENQKLDLDICGEKFKPFFEAAAQTPEYWQEGCELLAERIAELEGAKKDCLMFLDRMEAIRHVDKTPEYEYGQGDANGKIPPAGECWKTPKEIAGGVIGSIAKRVRNQALASQQGGDKL